MAVGAVQGTPAEAVGLAESSVAETRASDDIEVQARALVFLAETHLALAGGAQVPEHGVDAAEQLASAGRAAEEARVRFKAKGDVVSEARAADLVRQASASVVQG
jgi:hypothetical protein